MKKTLCICFFILLSYNSCTQTSKKQEGNKTTHLTREERIDRVFKELEERGFEIDSIYTEDDRQKMRDTINIIDAERFIVGYDEMNLYSDKPNMYPVDSIPDWDFKYDEQMGLTYLAMDKQAREKFVKEIREMSDMTDKKLRDSIFVAWCSQYGFKVEYNSN